MKPNGRTLAGVAILMLLACSEGPSGPALDDALVFSALSVELGLDRRTVVTVVNRSVKAIGPVDLLAQPVRNASGSAIPGWSVKIDPPSIPTLNPGDEAEVAVELVMDGVLQPGRYTAGLRASIGDGVETELELSFDVSAPDGTVATLRIESSPATLTQGDVVQLGAVARDGSGSVVEDPVVEWLLDPPEAGWVDGAGRLVAYRPGPARLTAKVGEREDHADLQIVSRQVSGSLSLVGMGVESRRFTSDLWVHDGYAYLGTWSSRSTSGQTHFGNTLYTWSVEDPSRPHLTHSLAVDARTVNDVKIHPDRDLAVITHEGANDGQNGITLLDLSNPARPQPISRYTAGLQPGVHNVWLEGDFAYLVVDGVGSGLRVLDISDPSSPRQVASYWAGESFLHDVYVRDGLAFLSHWTAGLVILDVGNGIAGGSPENPVEVSRIRDLGGQTHNAWYWPERGYVFLGEEDFSTPGIMRVVDARDPTEPKVVATFGVEGQPPHNYWLDESIGRLYLAWYGRGIRTLDVSGELLGDLSLQGREIEGMMYNGGTGSCGSSATCTWAPQLEKGLLYLSDRNSGLVILHPGL